MRNSMGALFAAFMLGIAAQLTGPVQSAPANPDEAVRNFVEQVNAASTSFFSSGSEKDAREKCRDLLSWAFDVPAMGEYVLGEAWARASEQERKDFLPAFEDEIVCEYLHRMKGGTTMTFIGTRTPLHGDLLPQVALLYRGRPIRHGSGGCGHRDRHGGSSMFWSMGAARFFPNAKLTRRFFRRTTEI